MNSYLNHKASTDQDRSQLAGGFARVMGVILLFISGITSFAFFYQYVGGVFGFLSPALSPYFAGIVGVICFEVMSVGWRYLAANNADTERQISLANAGAGFALIGGIAVTVVYFAL